MSSFLIPRVSSCVQHAWVGAVRNKDSPPAPTQPGAPPARLLYRHAAGKAHVCVGEDGRRWGEERVGLGGVRGAFPAAARASSAAAALARGELTRASSS